MCQIQLKDNENNECHVTRPWREVLKQIVQDNFNEQPENIYQLFVNEMVHKHDVDEISLPVKEVVKKRITYNKKVLRMKAKRCIVWSFFGETYSDLKI